ncbi:Polynucleotide 5'-hydroxyl-kinase grc3 [Coemansia sp. RSA 2603]|nr:Polynucleotide 5'-hydroxyl-kinase grc3 [Coemansia sp. RSA 2603]
MELGGAGLKKTGAFTPRSRQVSGRSSRADSPRSSTPAAALDDRKTSNKSVSVINSGSFLPRASTWGIGNDDTGSRYMVVEATDQTTKPLLKAAASELAVSERYGVVVEIPDNQTVVFQGIVDICVLHGSVSVYEYSMTRATEWKRVYSPSSHPLLSIRASGATNRRQKQEVSSETAHVDSDIIEMQRLWEDYLKQNQATVRQNSAVVAIRSVCCGLEEIGNVAPIYRNVFKLEPLAKRYASSRPKGAPKRKLGMTRSNSAARIKRLALNSQRIQDTLTEASSTDDGDGMAVDTDADFANSDGIDHDQDLTDQCAADEAALIEAIGLPSFTPVAFITPDLQLLQVPRDWVETLDLASKTSVQLDEQFEPTHPVYVLAGSQGQGKSTFSRQLINRLLSRYGRIFFMEADLGQPELSPPGSLSLTMITDPLLGPPFTHTSFVEPYHAVYMGMLSPKNNPDRYVLAVQRLVSVYRDYISSERAKRVKAGDNDTTHFSTTHEVDLQTIPLVVNTQGWLKGLGLDLHYSLCEAIQPTNYIQMYDPAVQQQGQQAGNDGGLGREQSSEIAPLIDFSSITDQQPRLSWISAMGYDRASQVLLEKPATTVLAGADDGDNDEGDGNALNGGVTEQSARKGFKLVPRDMRDLSLISHFYLSANSVCSQQLWNPVLWQIESPTWSMRTPLAARRPLVVPWSDLVIWLGDEDVPPSQLLRSLNGTVVGVIAVASAPSSSGHMWSDDEVRGLYLGGKGISDQGAVRLSEPGSRVLLRAASEEGSEQTKTSSSGMDRNGLPQIVYGHPSADSTSFLSHALVRSVDPIDGSLHILLPPLLASGQPSSALNRIVGILRGSGPASAGVELPVWAMTNGGYGERAIGLSAAHGAKTSVPLGAKEAPYISVEYDAGVGASTKRTGGALLRRSLQ